MKNKRPVIEWEDYPRVFAHSLELVMNLMKQVKELKRELAAERDSVKEVTRKLDSAEQRIESLKKDLEWSRDVIANAGRDRSRPKRGLEHADDDDFEPPFVSPPPKMPSRN